MRVAVKVIFPRVGGAQLHVAEKFGDVPEVGVAKHLEIRFPDTKKRTRPATVEVTVIVIETPLYALPERDGVPNEALTR